MKKIKSAKEEKDKDAFFFKITYYNTCQVHLISSELVLDVCICL